MRSATSFNKKEDEFLDSKQIIPVLEEQLKTLALL
jgi:hypothetical protein